MSLDSSRPTPLPAQSVLPTGDQATGERWHATAPDEVLAQFAKPGLMG
jgi:hypothetical protein